MKKLSVLLICFALCNCQAYQKDKLERQNMANLFAEIDKREAAKKVRIEELRTEDPAYYAKIKAKKINIGMPEEYLGLSWGRHKRKNETCRSSKGCLTQYVYSRAFVYVRNGKITSWTTRR